MFDPLFIFLLLPVILTVVLIIYIIIKPQSREDLFFKYNKKIELNDTLKRLEDLEKINNETYTKEKEKIEYYFSDNKLTDRELEFMQTIITNRYFNNHEDRWIAYKKAPILLKLIFILSLINGVLIIGLIYLGFLSIFLTMLSVIVNRGSVLRTSILLEELSKSLKPGGRQTEITFPNSDYSDFDPFY